MAIKDKMKAMANKVAKKKSGCVKCGYVPDTNMSGGGPLVETDIMENNAKGKARKMPSKKEN